MIKNVPYVDLVAQWRSERDEIFPIIEGILKSGQYVGSEQVESFEEEVAAYLNVKYACALNSGTDALVCGLHALGIRPGDEVITPPNSFVASTAAIVHLGATPVFVDVQPDQNIDPGKISAAVTGKTKAIMPVHLTGRVADMPAIMAIAEANGLLVIEDAAQAAGSAFNGVKAGAWGAIGCFSTHPLKNLNALGDGGFLVTSDQEIYQKVSRMRNHGLKDRDVVEEFGYVSRLDCLQACILRYRLSRLESVIKQRKQNSNLYREFLDSEFVSLPPDRSAEDNSWHTFVIQVPKRDALRAHLRDVGIETAIHYPIPIHLQPAAEFLGYSSGSFPQVEKQAARILTLPIHQHLRASEIMFIAREINEFFLKAK